MTESKTQRADVASRITAYLSCGGLINPEYARHDAVSELLIDCRDELAAAKEQITALKAALTEAETQSQRNFDSWMEEVAKRKIDIQKCERIARMFCVTGLQTVANSTADKIRIAFPEDFE